MVDTKNLMKLGMTKISLSRVGGGYGEQKAWSYFNKIKKKNNILYSSNRV